MAGYAKEAQEISELLDLKRFPIACAYLDQPVPTKDGKMRLAACLAIEISSREGCTLNLSRKTCACIGGQHWLGFNIKPLGFIAGVISKGIYKGIPIPIPALARGENLWASREKAEEFLSRLPQPKEARDKYLVLSPLKEAEFTPQIVFFVCNNEQAIRLLGLVAYSKSIPLTFYVLGATCSTIMNAITTGKLDINFIDPHVREYVKQFGPDEVIVSLPLKDFQTAVENIPHSSCGRAKNWVPGPTKKRL